MISSLLSASAVIEEQPNQFQSHLPSSETHLNGERKSNSDAQTNTDHICAGPKSLSAIQTYHGYIHSSEDALLIVEACRQGLLRKTSRRLTNQERKSITSGCVFVFEEHECGIKRWTDGRIWSPSRILENFLVYREVDRKEPAPRTLHEYNFPAGAARCALSKNEDSIPSGPLTSQKGTYYFKEQGMMKRTISISDGCVQYHLVCYYRKDDIDSNTLSRPCFDAKLSHITIPATLVNQQVFRKPHKTLKELRQEERIMKRVCPYEMHHNERESRDKIYKFTDKGVNVKSDAGNSVSGSFNGYCGPSSVRRATASTADMAQTAMILVGFTNGFSNSPPCKTQFRWPQEASYPSCHKHKHPQSPAQPIEYQHFPLVGSVYPHQFHAAPNYAIFPTQHTYSSRNYLPPTPALHYSDHSLLPINQINFGPQIIAQPPFNSNSLVTTNKLPPLKELISTTYCDTKQAQEGASAKDLVET